MTETRKITTFRISAEKQKAIRIARAEGRYPGGLQEVVDVGIDLALGLDPPPRMDAGILEGLNEEQIALIEIVAAVLKDPPQGQPAEDMMKALYSVVSSLEYMSGRKSRQAG